jgi:hypothetical protein
VQAGRKGHPSSSRVDLRNWAEQSPQPAGVVVHPNLADRRQGHRAGMANPNPEAAPTPALSVSQSEAVATAALPLSPWEPDPSLAPATLGVGVGGKRAAEVDRGLSNTCADTSCRQTSPVTCLVTVPSEATTKTRPAPSLRFQALKALIRSNPDHGTRTCGSTRLAASASVTNRKHWL